MAKTVYRLEVVREFSDKREAVKAAERLERMGGRTISVYAERHTESGQPFQRTLIWKDLPRESADISRQRATRRDEVNRFDS